MFSFLIAPCPQAVMLMPHIFMIFSTNVSTLQIFDCWPSCVAAPKPAGRRCRKPGLDRKPRQAYSARQLERLEAEFKVGL